MIKNLNENTSLKFQNLDPKYKKEKGVLGRLFGKVASCVSPTRNGRKYTEQLWENLFNSDLIKERFANGGIFGQLCHPDYEEVDMEKIACVMPEPPVKDKDGELVAYVDILDTPCGRIAYQLAKYGYKFGISSRGTGDLIDGPDGEEVDPDTYQLNAFDLVEIPAVESARLSFVESFDTNTKYGKTLKQRLTEELNAASDEDKEIMKEALNNLGLKESIMYKGYGIDKDIYGQGEYSVQVNGDDMMFETEEEAKKFIDELPEEDQINEVVNDAELDEIKDEIIPENIDEHDEIEFISKEEANKIYDGEANGKYPVMPGRYIIKHEPEEKVVAIDNSTEDAWTEEFDSEEEAIKWLNGEFEANEQNESISESCGDKEVVNESEEAGNAGNDLLVNELQESLLKNKQLVEDNLSLQEKLSVCNAKETKLGEELAKYKKALAQVSMKVKEVKSLKEELNSLNEALTRKDKVLQINRERLEKSIAGKKELNDKMSVLEESVNNLNSQNEELTKNVETLTEKLHTSNLVVQKCRRELKEARELYVQSRSESYGVKTKDVLSKLNESYSLNDVDSICESLSEYKRNMNKLPFRLDGTSKISIKESSHEYIRGNSNNDDDYVSDTLLNIANLK